MVTACLTPRRRRPSRNEWRLPFDRVQWRNRVCAQPAVQRCPKTHKPATHRPAAGLDSQRGTASAPVPLVSLLAHATRVTDVLPHLHQHALEVTGGVCSLLFEHNPRNGAMHATSGFGLDALPTDPLAAGPDETALVDAAFDARLPALVADTGRSAPDLAARLGAGPALIVPLARTARAASGMLAIGFRGRAGARRDAGRLGPRRAHVRDGAGLEMFRHASGAKSCSTICASCSTSSDQTLVYFGDAQPRRRASTSSATAPTGSSAPIAPRSGFTIGARAIWCCTPRRIRRTAWRRGGSRRRRRSAVARRVRHAQHSRSPRSSQPRAATPTTTVTVPLRGTQRVRFGTIVFEGARVEPGGELGAAQPLPTSSRASARGRRGGTCSSSTM